MKINSGASLVVASVFINKLAVSIDTFATDTDRACRDERAMKDAK